MLIYGGLKATIEEGRKIANENGAPVWIESLGPLGPHAIHETPEGMTARAIIVEPQHKPGGGRNHELL